MRVVATLKFHVDGQWPQSVLRQKEKIGQPFLYSGELYRQITGQFEITAGKKSLPNPVW